MKITVNDVELDLSFVIRTPSRVFDAAPADPSGDCKKLEYDSDGTAFSFVLKDDGGYELDLDSKTPVSIALRLTPCGVENAYHLIPCNIHGDNNLSKAKPGFFPNLTYEHPDAETSSPEWEFRADRASHPVSMVLHEKGLAAVSIEPYSDDKACDDGSFVRNGVFSALPGTCGVSLGYRNHPYTFKSKEMMTPPTADFVKKASVAGRIYAIRNAERTDSAKVIRDIYYRFRELPDPDFGANEYLEAFIDAYSDINWSKAYGSFTNCECRVPGEPDLKPWRPLYEIGWSGGGVITYPLLRAVSICGSKTPLKGEMVSFMDLAAQRINPDSGLFFDLVKPWRGSDVNGWWAGYIVKDCHCAYTNGSGIYYMLKLCYPDKNFDINREGMVKSCLTALDTVISLQLENGNYGYTYSVERPGILDDEGFSGCWFAAASVLAYEITRDEKYLKSADRAMDYYFEFVKDLNCWGTPMDTWKSVDQEGNLAFIKAARLLHEYTGGQKYLDMLEKGAEYEYLWRYGFRARPEFKPLKDSKWNSCGGSVTSVSNPHIHPMGLTVTGELLYLYRMTGDAYHLHRAADGICWGLSTMDLYPGTTGYGRLGVITERWCPSDGLTIETFSDTGDPSSIWFTFNGWAGASVLEGLIGLLDEAPGKIKDLKNMKIQDIILLIERQVAK